MSPDVQEVIVQVCGFVILILVILELSTMIESRHNKSNKQSNRRVN